MGRKREHGDERAQDLLAAAEGLLRSGGVDAVAVRAVAEAAGTTVRAVYSLFGSKDGMLEALAERGYLRLADLVEAAPVTDDLVADLVGAGVDGFRRFALGHTELFRLTFERIPRQVVSKRTAPAARRSYDAIATRVATAQERGLLTGVPTAEVVFAFHSTCLGLATSELSREPPPVGVGFWAPVRDVPGERLWRLALGALLRGFAPD